MFAVVNISGFQEIVKEGEKLTIPLQEAEEGATVVFKEVLLVSGDDGSITLGKPTVAGASVEVKILTHGRDAKIRVVKFRRRKRYLRTHGHKQEHTKVEVVKIVA